ncbi:hypothetical protein [Variovorax rhizosphaerae]|uniref:Uncharacterized protein n=1 Tax=Variovorax rhizosphaerae TaxID=1836200 RepID=A0ABU8WS78_9BURK
MIDDVLRPSPVNPSLGGINISAYWAASSSKVLYESPAKRASHFPKPCRNFLPDGKAPLN